ncbi:uncharacterized protein LACBIDRAFT_296898 [Laccaria bicolor S238N-H82]|uniref:Predicted protein n=1 Tax=Laccaria bicolor (strain S238N-H82 / ATCC MYA-4686) TaxID=486041 RepID=B0D9I7_LACBS|nr:uncharacterized protein LACBIDRAFT_296898 [Laccaria bicolor S238N-H82]EDR08588.1 predicted protein [Laccaria bicolor S238N-H82]|eukprot:XP_001880813.1 predicted protein [Laccaria bicolor S238N-H82]
MVDKSPKIFGVLVGVPRGSGPRKVWATLIHEDEIEVTKWVDAAQRRGVWNGKPVDVPVAKTRGRRDTRSKSHTRFRPFEIYGHLVGRNGEVVGIVSEAAWGRTIALGDRTLVYETFARLQAHGCLFVGISTGQVLIADGKVRLLDLYLSIATPDFGLRLRVCYSHRHHPPSIL